MVVSFYFCTFMTRSWLKHCGVLPFDVNAISNFVILDFEVLFQDMAFLCTVEPRLSGLVGIIESPDNRESG